MSMIKKYLKKYIYLQKKDSKLLIFVLIGKKITDIITKHLQQNISETMNNMIKKYLNKDTYLQKKGRKLLII